MRETIDAIFENGVLRPLRKLSMTEGQRVQLSVESTRDAKGDAAPSYDFSDLVGRLMWSGDSLAEQKKLRDEWR